MRPDVVCVWPRNADYPLWRQLVHDNRSKFGQVIVVFMNPNQGEDYREFVESAMAPDDCVFLDSPKYGAGRDWRDVAVKEALGHVTSYWVWFTEQDFLPVDEFFWTDVGTKAQFNDIVAVKVNERMHPCCILLSRSVLAEVKRISGLDFSPEPGVLDHFGKFQQAIEGADYGWAVVEESSYKHYNGLTHNFSLVSQGGDPNYKPEEFNDYLRQCLDVTVPLDDRFVKLVEAYLARVS